MTVTVAFVLKGYPRLSETFIAQEIRELEQRGLKIRIYSLRHPTDAHVHPVHEEIAAPIVYLPEYLYREPLRVWRAWRAVRERPGYRRARAAWRRDLARDPTPNRVRRFGQALVLAAELPAEVVRLHAHFLHTPASVARYAAAVAELPWSVSAHAVDIWTTPDWEIREKLADCDWAVTCTALNARHLSERAGDANKISLAYHGIDLARFEAPPESGGRARDGSKPADPVVILSVGRAVEKKGHDDLLRALAQLPADLNWRLVHIGGGPLKRQLARLAADLGIAGRVEWRGAQPQPALIDAYREADIFALACRIAPNGDRDGLPNVLLEAQSQGLACVSTRLSAIPELIEDGVTGVLAEPGASDEIAAHLASLIRDPGRRAALGAAGARRVREGFGIDAGLAELARRFAPEMKRDVGKVA